MSALSQHPLPLESPDSRQPEPAPAPASVLPPASPPRKKTIRRDLWCAIVLPSLMLEVRPSVPGTPVAVIEPARREILAVNTAAATAGVRPGQSTTTAWALCPGLRSVIRDPGAETRALERFAGWAGQFSPRLFLEGQGLVLEVGASLRLFGGLQALIGKIKAGLTTLGYTYLLGVAPTPLAALWRARSGQSDPVTDRDFLAGAVSSLPLAVMGLDPKPHEALRGLGLRTIGELIRLPRAGLGRRYGHGLLELLDKALGRVPDPRTCWSAPPVFEGRVELPVESTSLTLIGLAYTRLAEELAGFVHTREVAIRSLAMTLETGHETVKNRLECHAPLRDAERLHALIMTRLETVDLPGPVRNVKLLAADFVDHAPERTFSIIEGPESDALDAVLSRIAARLGEQAIMRLAPAPDHRPERASWIWRPRTRRITTAGLVRPGWPLWILVRPRRLPRIEDWPSQGGRMAALTAIERIESGWWDGHGIARDYYRMSVPGGAEHWVYRNRSNGDWFLHGYFL